MEEEKKIIVTIALETVQLKISSRGEEGLGGKLTNQYHVKLGLLWNGFSDSEVRVKKQHMKTTKTSGETCLRPGVCMKLQPLWERSDP